MTITAKFQSTCPVCQEAIRKGEQVSWSKGQKAQHLGCTPLGYAKANPWIGHMRQFGAHFGLDQGWGPQQGDYWAADYPPGRCGADAWKKPTIGTYKCVECGAIRFDDGTWSESHGGQPGEF
jgi:hypothetical protein